MNIKEKWKQYQYYAIIGVISLIALFFLPMIGSEAGLAWKVPTTVVGWIVYIVSKLLVAVINILIFHCFILQGKLNIQENSKYIEAQEILNSAKSKEVELPRSPSQYNKDIYGKKGLTIFATSLLSAVGLTQAVLTFDWISMLTYLFTVLMGIIFGILLMNQTELYYTEEYPRYVSKVKPDMELAEKESNKQEHDSTDDSRGADVLEPIDSCGLSRAL